MLRVIQTVQAVVSKGNGRDDKQVIYFTWPYRIVLCTALHIPYNIGAAPIEVPPRAYTDSHSNCRRPWELKLFIGGD